MAEEYSVEQIFKKAILEGCSDVHLKPGSPPKMRKNGKLVVIPGFQAYILTPKDTARLVADTMDAYALPKYSDSDVNQLDYSFELPDGMGRFRMNAYRTRNADALVGRLLVKKAKSLDELGVHPDVKSIANAPAGLIIVSGATGSGKSTTLAGIIDHINVSLPVQIISIEDPIEVEMSDAMASIAQREIGVDVSSFEDGLNAALRQDPDVILIGEVRTVDALKIAIRAADTGHLVITTLHTTDASKALNRIITMFPADERDLARQQLSAVLRGVVAQRLVPNVEGTRSVVNEILINTPEVAQKILDGASESDIHKIIETSGNMITFEQRFLALIEAGKVDLSTAKKHSLHPEWFDTAEIKTPRTKVEAKEIKKIPLSPAFGSSALKKPLPKPPQPHGSNPIDLLN